ncbi:hypothetical protein OEZ86_005770 [Tetradesmus obliquus]|nr:hypothetical protein OEZ86_005770 [Tetradesmus obliquus]
MVSTKAFSSASSRAGTGTGTSRITASLPFGSAAGSGSSGVGSVQQQQQQQQQQGKLVKQPECQHFVEKLTGLKIKLPRVSGIVLRERYKQMSYVPVSKARNYVAPANAAWVVVGVLVQKSIGSTSAGAPYSRWRLSDLSGSDTWLALFGDAHKEHYAEAEGSVLAFYSPRFAAKGPGSSSSSGGGGGGLAVSQASQVERLASSAGWGFCRGSTKAGSRCTNAVDTTVSQFCQYHALQQAKTLRKAPTLASRGSGSGSSSGGLLGPRSQAAAAAMQSGGAGQHTAAANSGKVAANCAAEARRRKQAEQAELREALRRKLLKQQAAGKPSQEQQQQQQTPPPSSQTPPAAATAGTLLSSAADAAHDRLLGKLLDQYQQKDDLAQQLEGITKLTVTAFECRTCNALTEKRRASCSAHDVAAVRVTKRWWICEACGWRLSTLREVMPSKRCPKCRDPGVLFRQTSAYAGSKPMLVNPEAAVNPMASRDGMLARGMEHAFCLQNSI